MAKVMISLPDDLLAAIDRSAREQGSTRSGLIQELAQAHLRREDGEMTRRITHLLSAARAHDGRGTEHVRVDRRR